MRSFIKVLSSVLLTSAVASPAMAARFWFGGVDPVVLKQEHSNRTIDFDALFQPNAPWQSGEARVSVFKVSTQFVLAAPEAELSAVFQDMHRRHIQMAVEIGTVVRLDACGMGEGYAPRDLSDRVGRRLQSLGLTLDYMAADEPVWFTHEKTWETAKNGAPNCAYTLPVVAERVAMSVAAMRRYFPAIELGDIEVVASDRTPPAELIADYANFARLIKADTGRKLAFFHADIAWHTAWQPMMAPLKRAMNAQGVPFGMVIGGSPEHVTDQEWVAAALERLRFLLSSPATRPDDIVIQSWQKLPTRMLPETARGTSTYLLSQAENLVGR